MADKRISQLEQLTDPIADGDEFALNDISVNFDKKAEARQLLNYTGDYNLGFMGISLTNFSNLLEPQIAGGSVVEIEGNIYNISISISISGLAGIAISNDVYIYLTVSGTAFTAAATTSAPIWSTSKQGWYSGNDRCIAGLYKNASSEYERKYLAKNEADIDTIKKYGNGDADIENDVDIKGDLTTADIIKDININKVFTNGGSWLVPLSGTFVIPKGIFNYVNSSNQGTIQLGLFVAGSWRTSTIDVFGGFIISDGVNQRFQTSGSGGTIHYQQLD